MGTSTVLSAMEWRQPSRLPTTSSGEICMPAYKLHKPQRASSGLSHLIKRVIWTRCGRRKSLCRYARTLTEKAAEIEKTIVVKEHERERSGYHFDSTMFYENRFWNQRPDGIVINKYHRTLYILVFKRSSERNEHFLRVKKMRLMSNTKHHWGAQSGCPGMDVWTDQFCGRETRCSSGRWIP